MGGRDFDGRVALVTGAGRGMGRAVAEALIARGAQVGVNDLGVEAEWVADELGPGALALPADVRNREQVDRMIAKLEGHFGPVDTLVNNAGILFATRFEAITEDEWRSTLDVNLTGAFYCTQATLPAMRSRGFGRIVNISSSAGKTVSTLGGAHYTASKHGLLGLTRAVALEVADHGITVNAVCPGLIDTDMARENASPERIEAYERAFPAGRLGTPREVADLVCFLASAEAGYITGASIDINGGDLMV